MLLRRSALVAVLTGLAAPAAHATLVYQKGVFKPAVYAAHDDGTHRALLAKPGLSPHITPDGGTVLYETPYTGKSRPRLIAAPNTSPPAPGRELLRPVFTFQAFAISPDSRYVLTVSGKEVGMKKLVLIDIASGASRVIDTGQFAGASFSPDSTQFVYARYPKDRYPPKTDLFTAAVAGGTPTALTDDQRSTSPVWGPTDIVFGKYRKPKRKEDAYKQDLYLVAPAGGPARRLTHTKPPFLLAGLWPMDWSADGKHLLAEFEGQDTSFAKTVNPTTGKVRTVGKPRLGIVGSRLSRDGKLILATTGGYDPGDKHNVVTLRYGGNTPKVLVKNALMPDWNK